MIMAMDILYFAFDFKIGNRFFDIIKDWVIKDSLVVNKVSEDFKYERF